MRSRTLVTNRTRGSTSKCEPSESARHSVTAGGSTATEAHCVARIAQHAPCSTQTEAAAHSPRSKQHPAAARSTRHVVRGCNSLALPQVCPKGAREKAKLETWKASHSAKRHESSGSILSRKGAPERAVLLRSGLGGKGGLRPAEGNGLLGGWLGYADEALTGSCDTSDALSEKSKIDIQD